MKEKEIKKEEIIKLLLKKANGFYYTEEQFEFERKENKKINTNQMNLFDLLSEQKNAKYKIKTSKNTQNPLIFTKNMQENNNDTLNCINLDKNLILQKNNKKVIRKKVVTGDGKNETMGDIMELSNKCSNYCGDDNLVLVKKKVSNHYVPPDITAIKILFEIFDEKVNEGDIESMTDDELIKLKKQLLEEIENENF